MFRFRLASLAFACGMLLTLSGCFNGGGMCCNDGGMGMGGGRLFGGRLFGASYSPTTMMNGHGHAAECDCQTPAGMPGPFISGTPQFPPQPIPITNVPPGGPPQIFKVPQAPATPFFPAQ